MFWDRRWVPFVVSAVIIFALDRITKLWVLNKVAKEGAIRVSSFFNIVYVTNKGGAFGIGRHSEGYFFIVASVVAMVVVLLLVRKMKNPTLISCVSLGAVFGGGLGNLYDRLVYGSVVDFLDFHIGNAHWPAFNLADSAVVVGVIVFAFFYKPVKEEA